MTLRNILQNLQDKFNSKVVKEYRCKFRKISH